MKDEYGDRLGKIWDEVDKKIPGCIAQYSAYPVVDDLPVNNLKEVALEGKVMIWIEPDSWWDEGVKTYKSGVLKNPTWLTLTKHANKLMRHSGDHHHCFFEGFKVINKVGEITYIDLYMGS